MRLRYVIYHYRKKEDGVVAVEFAMIAFGFLLLLFSILEAGYVIWSINTVSYSIEKGARYAAINDASTSDTKDHVKKELESFYIKKNSTTLQVNKVQDGGVDFIELKGEYTYKPLIGTFILPDGSITFDLKKRYPIPAAASGP